MNYRIGIGIAASIAAMGVGASAASADEATDYLAKADVYWQSQGKTSPPCGAAVVTWTNAESMWGEHQDREDSVIADAQLGGCSIRINTDAWNAVTPMVRCRTIFHERNHNYGADDDYLHPEREQTTIMGTEWMSIDFAPCPLFMTDSSAANSGSPVVVTDGKWKNGKAATPFRIRRMPKGMRLGGGCIRVKQDRQCIGKAKRIRGGK